MVFLLNFIPTAFLWRASAPANYCSKARVEMRSTNCPFPFLIQWTYCLYWREGSHGWLASLVRPPCSAIVRHVLRSNKLLVAPSSCTALICSLYQQGKSHRLQFPASMFVSSKPLQLITLSWCIGPTPLLSINNKMFYFCIFDDFTKYIWLFPITHKFEVAAIFLRFKRLVDNYFGWNILAVQSDNGGEFRTLQSTLQLMGITYRSSCPHTHHQMGFVEYRHKLIVEIGLTLLATARAPLTLWDSAFETTYLINRLPSKVIQHKSPFQFLFNLTPC